MSETILITGGAGFVGSNLAIRLKKDYAKTKIIALDNLKRRGSELNIQRFKDIKIDFIHGDIRNKEDLERVGAFDLLIECSAEPSVVAGFNESPEYLINTNLFGTVNCLEMVRKHKAAILFLSTSRVYSIKRLNQFNLEEKETRFELSSNQTMKGVSANGISEEFSLESPRSLYGTTKLASEYIIQEYIGLYNLKGIINRCAVLTGRWQMAREDQGFVGLWVARHIYGGKLSYIGFGGKGKQVRDIMHVDDLYKLIIFQLDNLNKYSGEIFNVGGGKDLSISLLELTKICREVSGNEIEISSVPENRSADIIYYVSDCAKIKKFSGWKAKIPIKTIISEIADWISQNKDNLRPILSPL